MPKIQYEGPQNSLVDIDVEGNLTLPDGATINGSVLSYSSQLDIYIDSAGDDDNDGTMGSPIATMAEAERRIPMIVENPVALHLKAQAYTMVKFRRRLLSSGIYFIADESWDPTVETVQTSPVFTGTGIAGVGTTPGSIVDAGLTVDALNGLTIEMTSGAANGQRRTIRDNLATTSIPCIPFGSVVSPVAGDTYKVTRWNTCELVFPGVANGSEVFFEGTSEVDDGRTGAAAAGFSGYCFIGLKLRADAVGLRPRFHDANYIFFGVEKGFGGTVAADNGWAPEFVRAHAGFGGRGTFTNPAFVEQAPLSLASGRNYLGWGLFQDVSTDRDIIISAGAEAACLVAGVGKQLRAGSSDRDSFTHFVGRLEVTPTTGIGAALSVSGPAKVRLGSTNTNQPATRLYQSQGDDVVAINNSSGSPVVANGRSVVSLENAELSTAGIVGSGSLVRAIGPCDVTIEASVTGVPGVVLPGFGNKAIDASAGAYVRLNGAPGIGGGVAESDFDVGNGVPKNKTFFAATGDHIAHTDGTVITRVS